jgi:hypothetical protein
VGKVNDAIALCVTNFVGSMWCAYLFAAFAIWGAPSGVKTLGFQNWFAEEFLQLVLLSVIMVGQNVQAKKHDEIAEKVEVLHASHISRTKNEAKYGEGVRQEEG